MQAVSRDYLAYLTANLFQRMVSTPQINEVLVRGERGERSCKPDRKEAVPS